MRRMAAPLADLAGVQRADLELMKLRVKSWIFNPTLRDSFLKESFQDPAPDRDVNKWIWEAAQNWFLWDQLKDLRISTWICASSQFIGSSLPHFVTVTVVRQSPALFTALWGNTHGAEDCA